MENTHPSIIYKYNSKNWNQYKTPRRYIINKIKYVDVIEMNNTVYLKCELTEDSLETIKNICKDNNSGDLYSKRGRSYILIKVKKTGRMLKYDIDMGDSKIKSIWDIEKDNIISINVVVNGVYNNIIQLVLEKITNALAK